MGAQAALACAWLWALTEAYHLILDPLEVAVLAQRVAVQIAGTLAGIADAATAMVGRMGQVLALRCQPHDMEEYVEMPPELMVAAMQFEEREGAETYREVRVATFMAQGMISRFFADMGVKKDPTRGYLGNVPTETFDQYLARMLPEQMTGTEFLQKFDGIADRHTWVEAEKTYALRGAAAFHVGEQTRAATLVARLKAMCAANAEDRRNLAQAAGTLMYESHAARTRELAIRSATADTLVEMVRQRGPGRGLYGAHLAGSAGGEVTVLADAEARAELEAIARECQEKTGRTVLVMTGSSDGAAETAPRHVAVTAVGGHE
jgi:galactokinase